MFKNGNRTHDNLEKWESNPWIRVKKWESNPWICWWCELKQTTGLKFSSESVTKDVNLTYPIVWAWESNPGPTQVWNRKPIQGVQGDSNTWLCFKVGLSNINVRIWKSNPWLLCCETKYWSKKKNIFFLIIFFFFIPWWWVLSTMGLLLLLIMKLFIV